MQINLKMILIKDNSQGFCQHSKSKEHFPLTDSGSLYICLLHKKMHIYEYVCKSCPKKLTIFLNCGDTLEKPLKPVTFL